MPLFGDKNARLKQKILKTEKRKQQLHAEKKESSGLTCDNNVPFDSVSPPLGKKTLKALEEMNISELTETQSAMIPIIRMGEFLHLTARTGSGKTLGYLIPVIELLNSLKFYKYQATAVVILCPTRELCMQTFGVAKNLLKFYSYTVEILLGGEAQFLTEQEFLAKDITIVICTPIRLLQHLKKTEKFDVQHLRSLVLDEADKILTKFKKEMDEIDTILPKQKQIVLVSATKSQKAVEFGSERVFKPLRFHDVDLHEDEHDATALGLTQNYIEYSMEKKFWLLRWLLDNLQKKKKKVLVFFNSCESVNYYWRVLRVYSIFAQCIHGEVRQRVRARTFNSFNKLKYGILLCTGLAERGLDIFGIDYVIQFDPPQDCEEYIHRVGRTARNGARGEALMLLQDHELSFVDHLAKNRISVGRKEIQWSNILSDQQRFEQRLRDSRNLRSIAVDAFYGYLTAYRMAKLKEFFDNTKLNLPKIAKSFGLFKVLEPNKGKWVKPLDQDGFIAARDPSQHEISQADKQLQMSQLQRKRRLEGEDMPKPKRILFD